MYAVLRLPNNSSLSPFPTLAFVHAGNFQDILLYIFILVLIITYSFFRYAIMWVCWKELPNVRPSFQDMASQLHFHLEHLYHVVEFDIPPFAEKVSLSLIVLIIFTLNIATYMIMDFYLER